LDAQVGREDRPGAIRYTDVGRVGGVRNIGSNAIIGSAVERSPNSTVIDDGDSTGAGDIHINTVNQRSNASAPAADRSVICHADQSGASLNGSDAVTARRADSRARRGGKGHSAAGSRNPVQENCRASIGADVAANRRGHCACAALIAQF
jgi:hypothetical protein